MYTKKAFESACKLVVLIPLTLCALEKKPWFGNLLECQLDSAFTYSRYHQIQNACVPFTHPINDYLVYFDLGIAPASDWAVDVDMELAQTPERSFGVQSYAGQFRMLWLDDVIGQACSLVTGVSARGVTPKSVRDVNSPYHSYFNAEVNMAIGKELVENAPFWRVRSYLFAAVGMANKGSPWTRGNFYLDVNARDRHQWSFFAESYFGFGSQRLVNVDNFHGYAKIHHQSVDVGLAYRYGLGRWGLLSVEYARRVFARSFPENVNFFTLRYQLPFSPV